MFGFRHDCPQLEGKNNNDCMIDGWNKFSVIHNFFTECINRDAKNKF